MLVLLQEASRFSWVAPFLCREQLGAVYCWQRSLQSLILSFVAHLLAISLRARNVCWACFGYFNDSYGRCCQRISIWWATPRSSPLDLGFWRNDTPELKTQLVCKACGRGAEHIRRRFGAAFDIPIHAGVLPILRARALLINSFG